MRHLFYPLEARGGNNPVATLVILAYQGFARTDLKEGVSRDTLEILKIIKFLRERGINMHFEKEKLDSIEADKEFDITLRGMLAQDESRNTSENIQWGFQRKFDKGDIFSHSVTVQLETANTGCTFRRVRRS